jgi:hypothetical protein
MKRLLGIVVAAGALTFGANIPAHAAQPRTVRWICDVPGEGLVTFVTAAEAARQGIDTANAHAGETFFGNFGEVCSVE